MFGFIAALVSGALMSIQGVFNTEVTKQTGTWLTNSFVQFTGFLLCLVIWFFKERKKHKKFCITRMIIWWLLTLR